MKSEKGMTLIELMVAIAIFAIVISAALGFLSNLTTRSSQETAKTRTSQEGIISDLILIRDIAMAGMGVPGEVAGQFVPIGSNNNVAPNGYDELVIKGAGISSGANDYFKWGYNTNYISAGTGNISVSAIPDPNNPALPPYSVDVQNLFTLSRAGYQHPFENGDMVVFLDAETKQLLGTNIYTVSGVGATGFNINPNTDFTIIDYGGLIFSLGGMAVANFANYMNTFTGYRLSAGTQPQCAPNTRSLLRVYGGATDPVLDCVLGFQVQFGLVQFGGTVNWIDDISGYSSDALKKQLKLVKVFIVKQFGKRDRSYYYPNASITTADNTVNLTVNQRQYRWRVITLDIPLRELQ